MAKKNIFPRKETRQRFTMMVKACDPVNPFVGNILPEEDPDITVPDVEQPDIPCDEIVIE